MSEMCYFLHDDIDMGAHIYTCGHQKEMTLGECPCKDGISCDFFVSKSEVDKLVRQYVNNREKSELKKGHWEHVEIYSANSERMIYRMPDCSCSECGIMIQAETNYCPNCGADMRIEE